MRSRICCALLLLLGGACLAPALAQTDRLADAKLFAAIDQENPATLQAAIAGGASLSARGAGGKTPLVAAAAQGSAAIVRALLQAGADPNEVDANHDAPVIQAAFDNQIDVMRVLLASHPRLDVQNPSGWSALSLAINRRNPEMIELLVAAGASVNTVSVQTGHSLLAQAYVDNDDYELIGLLRGAGATFSDKTDELFATAANADITGMRRALDSGAKVNFANAYGETPLCVAARKGNTLAARTLLAAGADPNIMGKDQLTALSWAIFSGHAGTISALLDAGGGCACAAARQADRSDEGGRVARRREAYRLPGGTGARCQCYRRRGTDGPDAGGGGEPSRCCESAFGSGADANVHDRRGRAAADLAHERKFDNLAALLAQAEENTVVRKH